MRTIRASEIGLFMYCKLAWWHQLQGVEASNKSEMAAGTSFHQQHARRVYSVRLLQLAAFLFFLGALAALGVWLASLIP